MNNHIEMASRKGRHFLFSSHFLIPISILILTTIVFNLKNWDMAIQARFYQPDIGWHYGDAGWAKAIYKYGNIPALIVILLALLALFRGFKLNSVYTKYRRLAIYLVIVLLLGPGLIVNSFLKDKWGRPRPRDTEQFGGKYSYEAPLVYDSTSPGKSFPCGHATMGFYFFALAFVMGIFRKSHYYLIMLFATIYGALIGWVRMLQGGHFASDVLWAGALLYLTSWVAFRAMKLHINPLYVPKTNASKLKPYQMVILVLLFILIPIGISLANPYNVVQRLDQGGAEVFALHIDIQNADVAIAFSDSTYIENRANGHGFPGSKARITRSIDGSNLMYSQKVKGWFTELAGSITVVVDTLNTKSAVVTVRDGEVSMNVPSGFQRRIYVKAEHLGNLKHSSVVAQPASQSDSTSITLNASKIVLQESTQK